MALLAGTIRRAELKTRYWSAEHEWHGASMGWFKAPRTLPLILVLLSERALTHGRDVGRTYVELLSRHLDSGIVEIGNESDHAYSAGYTGTRAIRTWHERMQLLEELGLIKTRAVATQRYKLVLVVDPLFAVAALRNQRKVSDGWWEAYTLRLLETKEADDDQIHKALAVTKATAKALKDKTGLVEAPRRARRILFEEES